MPTISPRDRERIEQTFADDPAALRDALVRLEDGEPIEYILGRVDFLGATVDLSHRPMIPRPETAFWVARAIEELQERPGPLRLADTFSGAGNVGIALLKNLPGSRVDLSEFDAALIPQIEINVLLNGIDPERARIFAGDTLQGLTGSYDAIFAVPPYVPDAALPELDPEMIRFEPHLAFFGGEDGHRFHRALVAGAWDLLASGGTLYMEADMDHEPAIRAMLPGTRWSSIEFWPDPYGATPNVVLRK